MKPRAPLAVDASAQRWRMYQLTPCRLCGAEISDLASRCPHCLKQMMTAEQLSSRFAQSTAAAGGLILLGPVAIATAFVVGPLSWDGNRQLKNLAKRVKCIDSIELSDSFEMFVTATEFIPVMTGLGSVVPRPGFLRSDLRAASLDPVAAREKGLFRGERAVLQIDYFDRGIRKRDFTERFTFSGKHAQTRAALACLKFNEYQATGGGN